MNNRYKEIIYQNESFYCKILYENFEKDFLYKILLYFSQGKLPSNSLKLDNY